MILSGEVARIQNESNLARQRNYELATLISYAFNDPKNMPSYSDGQKKAAPDVSDELAQIQVRSFFIAMAGGVKAG